MAYGPCLQTIAILSVVGLGLSACGDRGPGSASNLPGGDPEAIRDAGELVVLTRNAPTTWYYDRDGEPAGLEHDFATAFAAHLGVPVRFEFHNSIGAILAALANGEGHFAAAGLTGTEGRQEQFLLGPPYQTIAQQVVCRRGSRMPRDLDDLVDRSLMVTGSSSYIERLHDIEATTHPDLRWQVADTAATEIVLQRVWDSEVDCAVADSNIVAINRRYMPELQVAFPLTDGETLNWLLPANAEGLRSAMEEWFEQAENSGFIATTRARYYAHVEIFDYVDIARFVRRIDNRLPHFRDTFEEAGRTYGIDWHLLAAQAYQESHWEPTARSPTGVRGMMMLTLPTAREVGVDNRLDPEQSILGGARYLANLESRLPDSVTEPDRTWKALAAYNVGMGHLYDARALARRLERDPDAWHEMREVLPLLADPDYYQDLRFGYARGNEPVQYLQRIRNYEDILRRHLEQQAVATAD
ncbi:MAG: membrane-bound lytic murein transglycosylase MltF [Gammaproteobacteria bacterium]|nr:membrane-bound lytic murein transglycosylase MltF [Gammaproteobacteria bacterium]